MNLSKGSKIIIFLALFGLIGALVALNYVYKPHAQIEEQAAMYEGGAEDFKADAISDSENMINKIVLLNGTLTGTESGGGMLNETIFCQFKNPDEVKTLSVGKPITIKGRFIGYDDILEEIKLDQCIVVKKGSK